MKNWITALGHESAETAFFHRVKFMCRARSVIRAVSLLALAVPMALVAQTTVISNLNPAELTTALQSGGTVTFAIDGTIVLTNTITLSNSVVLDGTNHSITISGGGNVEIFNILPAGQITLRNLTLANGVSIGTDLEPDAPSPSLSAGGAIFSQGTLEVENCNFRSNSAPGGTLPFSYDGSSGFGGAIYNAGWLSITNASFASNAANGGSGIDGDYISGGSGVGGAIYNAGGTISLLSVSFSNNTASGGSASGGYFFNHCGNGCGGAIYSLGGSILANNIQVFNNSVRGGQYAGETGPGYGAGSTAGQGDGGALYLAGCVTVISNGLFSNNVAAGGSGSSAAGGQTLGGSICSSGSTQFWYCDFENSQAKGSDSGLYGGESLPGLGGAIYNGGTMEITTSTFSNNSATGGQPSADAQGGAIYNSGSLQIESATLAGNNAAGASSDFYSNPGSGWGGAVYNSGNMEIGNSTLKANTTECGADVNETGLPFPYSWGGGIANTGFIQISSTILSSNISRSLANNIEAIYNTGVIQADAQSSLIPNIAGTPPLTYQWQLNGANIAGATNSVFNLGSVQFANSGTYDLVISNSSGLVTNFMEIINQPPPPLAISGVTPSTGLTLGGTSVTIVGTGFTNGATVSFGNAAATSVTVASATNITATTPAAAAAGPVNVTVINGDFQMVVLTNGFTYVAPVAVSSPLQGPGTNGVFVVDVGGAGITGYNSFTVEGSTDLVNWFPLQTNSSPFTFKDTNAADYSLRFYRAVLTQ